MKSNLINEEFLAQVEMLQSLIKNNVGGMFGGNHQSKTYGSSCEFADYRDYIPGDDVTKIDWNAFARFDKLYQKLFLDERQMHTKIYIDASRSMEYSNLDKAECALKLAATIAYISLNEMDKVSIYAIRDKKVHTIINGMVGKDAYISNIGKLNEVEFSGDCYISDAIMPESVGYGDGLSVIISDFLTDNNYENAINYLNDKRRDVLCIQLLSKEEINPLIRGKVHFFDSENVSKAYRKNINRDIINAYRKAVEYATGRLRDLCASIGASYILACAEDDIADIFFGKMIDMGVLK
ncbi:MAG: DUF58 domain-containing protein [Clostridia bacterium]|nr:DUF58 domain-containing protein [Clostridia bacterium]MBQ7789266.1 DUF58 domain-containing protein [Clostridia bacterium]